MALSEDELEASIRGVWNRYPAGGQGEDVRFWYFHGDGHGLYRYGRVGLTQTHSFDYQITQGQLHLRFRHFGELRATPWAIEQDRQGRRWIAFAEDPREPGARYRHESAPLPENSADQGDAAMTPAQRNELGGKLWIDYRNLPTGAHEFRMYQFNASGIDGRGIGWFHAGDIDDWTTESLTYRIVDDRLQLFFDVRSESASTDFRLERDSSGRLRIILDRDPRDFWHRHAYVDGGASFGMAAAFGEVAQWAPGVPSPGLREVR